MVRLQHPAEDDPIPYSGTCGANTTSIRVATSPKPAQVGSRRNSPVNGPATAASRRATGVSTSSDHESRADATRPASPAPPRDIAAATAGTTAPASAPPATTSKSTFGSWFAAA